MTTDIISAWIDESALRQHAASLLSVEKQGEDFILINDMKNGSVTELPNDSQAFEEELNSLTTACPVIVDSKVKLNAVSALKRAAEGATNVVTNNQPVKPEGYESRGSLEFIQQELNEGYGCQKICILDRDGDVFIDTMGSPNVSQLIVSLTEPIRIIDIKEGAQGYGYLHLKVSAREILQIVVTSTSHGLLIIGMNRATPLSAIEARDLVLKIREMV